MQGLNGFEQLVEPLKRHRGVITCTQGRIALTADENAQQVRVCDQCMDDFLPKTATPLENIFKSIFCLPCLLFLVCLRDTFIPDGRKLRDPRRLYAPGRMYHIVERKFCRCGRFPPEVRTAIPVDGRFEHIVLSCNATSDHAIIWIERESESAKFQAIYEKFSKEKATHLQTLKGLVYYPLGLKSQLGGVHS
nr:calmodulin-binding heat-shock protein [Ipomoea batatas]